MKLLQKLKLSFTLLLLIFLLTQKDAKSLIIDLNNNVSNANNSYLKGDYNSSFKYFDNLNKKYPEDLNIKYNLGNSSYKKGDYDLAEKIFKNIVENKYVSKELKFKAFYNLGNTFYRQNKLEDAEKSYLSSLQINPNDIQAKKNLEKVRREIKQKEKQNQELRNHENKNNSNNKNGNNDKNRKNYNNKKNDKDKLSKSIRKQLNNLEESDKNFIKNQILKNITGNYGIEKDW